MKRITVFLILLILLFPLSNIRAEENRLPVKVGVLDTGILANHRELKGMKIDKGENFVFPKATSTDILGHGTRIAGLIGDTCSDVSLIPLVVVSRYPTGLQKSCTGEEIAQAIIRAIDEYDCKLLNISLGLKDDSQELRQAIEYAEEKGVVIVAAAGNSGGIAPETKFYPAAYRTVIAVGALDEEGRPASFSQPGYSQVFALGVNVPVISFGFSLTPPKATGTSYAAAKVTGLVAELIYKNPEWTPEEIRGNLL